MDSVRGEDSMLLYDSSRHWSLGVGQTSTPITDRILLNNLSTDSIVPWTPYKSETILMDDDRQSSDSIVDWGTARDDSTNSITEWTSRSVQERARDLLTTPDPSNSIVEWSPTSVRGVTEDRNSSIVVEWTPRSGQETESDILTLNFG